MIVLSRSKNAAASGRTGVETARSDQARGELAEPATAWTPRQVLRSRTGALQPEQLQLARPAASGQGSARPPGAEPPTAPANPPWRGSSCVRRRYRRSPSVPRPRASGGPLVSTLPQSTDRNRRNGVSWSELSPSLRLVHSSHDPFPLGARRRQSEWRRPVEGEPTQRGAHDDADIAPITAPARPHSTRPGRGPPARRPHRVPRSSTVGGLRPQTGSTPSVTVPHAPGRHGPRRAVRARVTATRWASGRAPGERTRHRDRRRGLVMVSEPDLLDAVLRLAAAAGCEVHARRWIRRRPAGAGPRLRSCVLDADAARAAARPGCRGARVRGRRCAASHRRRSGGTRSRSAPSTSCPLPEAETWLVAALAEAAEGHGGRAAARPRGRRRPRRRRGLGVRRRARRHGRARTATGRCSSTAIRSAAGSTSCSAPRRSRACAGPRSTSAAAGFPPAALHAALPAPPVTGGAAGGWRCSRATGPRTGPPPAAVARGARSRTAGGRDRRLRPPALPHRGGGRGARAPPT